MNFLRRSGEKFIFPEQIDRAEIDQTDIELRLPVPQFTGGTGRSVRGLVFGYDLSAYNVK